MSLRPGDAVEGIVLSAGIRNSEKTWDDRSPRREVWVRIDSPEYTVALPWTLNWWGDEKRALLKAINAAGMDDITTGAKIKLARTYDNEVVVEISPPGDAPILSAPLEV